MGAARWGAVFDSHELYNLGHLFEAAAAHYAATGKTNLLSVACRAADLVARTFGPEPTQLKDAPGHEKIELALCRLYRASFPALRAGSLTLIPYFAWCHRGAGEMQTWFRE